MNGRCGTIIMYDYGICFGSYKACYFNHNFKKEIKASWECFKVSNKFVLTYYVSDMNDVL